MCILCLSSSAILCLLRTMTFLFTIIHRALRLNSFVHLYLFRLVNVYIIYMFLGDRLPIRFGVLWQGARGIQA